MSPAHSTHIKSIQGKMGGVKILVVAGSSGGHIFPAVSFMQALTCEYKNADIFFVLPKKNILKGTQGVWRHFKTIPMPTFSPGVSAGSLKAFLGLFPAAWEAALVLLKFKPDIVIGFGSLICVPLILCAWFFRINTVIHEQNVIPGRANKLLAWFSDKVAISFPETKNYFKTGKVKIVCTGNPLRKELARIDKAKALEYFGFDDAGLTVLVTGGSQGSRTLNREFLQFAKGAAVRDKLQIIHLCGSADYRRLRNEYAGSGLKYRLYDFLDSMSCAYSASDLIISRAGAMTIAEIAYFRIPAVIVPYPYAYQHQLSNARMLEKKGCATIIDDSRFNSGTLQQVFSRLMNDRAILKEMQSGYDSFSNMSAAEELVSVVSSFGR